MIHGHRAGAQVRPRRVLWDTSLLDDGRVKILATLLALGVVLVFAAHERLLDLARPGRNYDEGVYLQSLLLMRHGYRPTRDIVATQGPLHLYLAYVSYALGGYTLQAARMGAVVASLACIGAAAWAGTILAGRPAGVAAAVALGLSPTLLQLSRQALPEALALAFVVPAVAAAFCARRSDRDRWRIVAGVLLGLALLVKPIVGPAAIPVLVLSFSRRSVPSSLLAPLTLGVVGIGGLALTGLGASFQQVVGWRLQGQEVDLTPGMVAHNAVLLVDKLYGREEPAFYALALLGAWLLARTSGRLALATGGWLVTQLAVLLVYSDLSSHLGVTLLPPLTLLLGVASARAWSAAARLEWPGPLPTLAAIATVWYLAVTPSLIARDQDVVVGRGSPDATIGLTERSAIREIDRLTDEDDWVITDAPYLAFLANRLVPPPLVDPSDARITAGAVTSTDAIEALRDYDVDAVVLWTGKLSRLEAFVQAVSAEQALIQQLGTGNDDLPRLIYGDPDEESGAASAPARPIR